MLNLLDIEAPVNVAEDEPEPEYFDLELALDSGAADHVADRVDVPNHEVVESEGSRSGQNFVAANGKKMPNEGKVELNMFGGDQEIKSTFQVAAVSRPLWSVGKICDQGFTASFNSKTAVVRNSAGKVVCRFVRKGGLYVSTLRLENPKHQGFTRQGK